MCLWLWWVESRRWGNSTQTRLWWGKEFRKFLITDRDAGASGGKAATHHLPIIFSAKVSPRANWRSSKCILSFQLQTRSVLPSSACQLCESGGAEGLTSLFHRVSALATHVIRWGHADRVTSCSILRLSTCQNQHTSCENTTCGRRARSVEVMAVPGLDHEASGVCRTSLSIFPRQLISANVPTEQGGRSGPLVLTISVSRHGLRVVRKERPRRVNNRRAPTGSAT